MNVNPASENLPVDTVLCKQHLISQNVLNCEDGVKDIDTIY